MQEGKFATTSHWNLHFSFYQELTNDHFYMMFSILPEFGNQKLYICTNTTEFFFFFQFHLVSTRVSNELGAGDPAAAKLAGCVVMAMAIIGGLLLGTVLILIRNVWGYAFSNEQEVVQYVADMLPMIAVSASLDGLQCVLSGSYFSKYFTIVYISSPYTIHFI